MTAARAGLTTGYYAVIHDGRMVAAYKENRMARARAAWLPGSTIVWTKSALGVGESYPPERS